MEAFPPLFRPQPNVTSVLIGARDPAQVDQAFWALASSN
jgi:aryl-alcohol dehydrogenase-like predicted oxidoreductase